MNQRTIQRVLPLEKPRDARAFPYSELHSENAADREISFLQTNRICRTVVDVCAEKRTSAELFVWVRRSEIVALSLRLFTSCGWCEYACVVRGIEPNAFSVCSQCTIPCRSTGIFKGQSPLNCSLFRFFQ